MGTHLQLPPEILRQLRLKVREGAERRTALYSELHGAFRELAELALSRSESGRHTLELA